MNCLPMDRSAALIRMSTEILRLTASMKTSNSSKHRMGEPIASQSESRRQIVENDFSPPESVFGPLFPVSSPPGWTSMMSSGGRSVCSKRNRPLNARSLIMNMNCARARALMCFWNSFQRARLSPKTLLAAWRTLASNRVDSEALNVH